MTEKLKVFLCHSSDDKPAVRKFHQKLKLEDWIDSWLDEEKILPGDDWHLKITEAVQNTDIVVVFLSNNSIFKRGYVQRELKFALDVALNEPEGAVFIIPIRLDNCKPPNSLSKWQYTDYFPIGQQDFAYNKVLENLENRAISLGLKNAHHKKSQNLSPAFRTWGNTEFVSIPKGEFIMGTDKGYGYEQPLHKVNIPYDYWMARFPVTVEQYKKFLEATDRWDYLDYRDYWKTWEKKKNHPVVKVAWDEAMSYCQWLNNHKEEVLPSGLIIRLPTEAEWEKAARGTDGREWSWGNEFDVNKCNFKGSNIGTTTPVGSFSPDGDSPYGCADMIGNVLEWVRTQAASYKYYKFENQEDITGNLTEKEKRIVRGGSFDENAGPCYSRTDFHFGTEREDIGFRVVVAPSIGGESSFISQTFAMHKEFQDKLQMPLSGTLQRLRKKT
ncbi:MAG: SUMF1/EgtB/PvdO family nonheme iron enzyme [Anaerolineales bacterium]|nr:MAG: SUMF1/EgtB/PvdO family nonheme iron enzyme [Anaerolineales bacterium]